jgi:hypothetical protein
VVSNSESITLNTKTPPNPDQITADRNAWIAERMKQLMTPAPLGKPKSEPVPAESTTPQPAEALPLVADQEGKAVASQGAQIPIGSIRPKPSPAAKEEGSVIVAKALAEQLGTAPHIKSEMRIDERKMGVLKEAEVIALSHFSYRYAYDGIRYWGHLVEWQLTGSQGVGGLGRRHILQALANTSGIQTVEKAEKPNVVARNLWNRTWKERATQQGKVPEE